MTTQHIIHEIPHAIFHVDRGFGPTFWQLLRYPGKTINGYLDGQRVRFTNPLTLLLILTGVTAFLYSQYPFDFSAGAAASMPPEIGRKYKEFLLLYYRYQSILLLLYLPVMALITKALFLPSGRAFGEHLVIAAFTMSLIHSISLAIFPVSVAAQTQGYFVQSQIASALLMVVMQARTWYLVFRPSGGRISIAFRVLIGLCLFYLLTFTVPSVLFSLVYLPLAK